MATKKPAEKKKEDVTIKRGNVEIKCDRMDLILVDQTPDGIIINLKGGMALNYTDQYMSINVKERIKQAVNHMAGNLEINLDDYNKPAKILG